METMQHRGSHSLKVLLAVFAACCLALGLRHREALSERAATAPRRDASACNQPARSTANSDVPSSSPQGAEKAVVPVKKMECLIGALRDLALHDAPGEGWERPFAEAQSLCRDETARQSVLDALHGLLRDFPPDTTKAGKAFLLLVGAIGECDSLDLHSIVRWSRDPVTAPLLLLAAARPIRTSLDLESDVRFWEDCFGHPYCLFFGLCPSYSKGFYQRQVVFKPDPNEPSQEWRPIPEGRIRSALLTSWREGHIRFGGDLALLGVDSRHCPPDVEAAAVAILQRSTDAAQRRCAVGCLSLVDSAESAYTLKASLQATGDQTDRIRVLSILRNKHDLDVPQFVEFELQTTSPSDPNRAALLHLLPLGDSRVLDDFRAGPPALRLQIASDSWMRYPEGRESFHCRLVQEASLAPEPEIRRLVANHLRCCELPSCADVVRKLAEEDADAAVRSDAREAVDFRTPHPFRTPSQPGTP